MAMLLSGDTTVGKVSKGELKRGKDADNGNRGSEIDIGGLGGVPRGGIDEGHEHLGTYSRGYE